MLPPASGPRFIQSVATTVVLGIGCAALTASFSSDTCGGVRNVANMETKLEQLRALMADGDWHGALRMAARFQRLGQHKRAIERGWEALVRPAFYRELGRDPEAVVAAGVEALRERYGEPSPAHEPA